MNLDGMLLYYILDDQGNIKAVPLLEWANWFERREKSVVAKTCLLGDKVFISTVFLGMNHNYFDDGPPILWETMVFCVSWSGEYQDRYSSKADALAGHDKAVAWAKHRRLYFIWLITKASIKRSWKACTAWLRKPKKKLTPPLKSSS